jgi:hypothetical protein
VPNIAIVKAWRALRRIVLRALRGARRTLAWDAARHQKDGRQRRKAQGQQREQILSYARS